MGRPLLSACLIARDEEAFLPGCLASLRGVADELVLVDTGSRDRTIELARAAGARVLSRRWDDDFAAPRTLAAREARGAFLLQLDADERLAPGAGEAIRAAAAAGGFEVGLLRLHNATRAEASPEEILSGAARGERPFLVPRLLRNTGDLEYRGIIHENLVDWMVRHGDRRRSVPADVLHLGYVPATMVSRAKRERNVALLRRRCALEGDDVVPSGYLAFELLQLRDFAGAEEIVRRGWAAAERAPRHHSILRIAVARGALALRRPDPRAALESAERVAAREGEHPDLDYLRGFAHEVLAVQSAPGDPARGEHLRLAEAALVQGIGRLDADVWEFVGAITAVGARLHLAAVHLVQHRPAEALERAREALRLEPRNPSAWLAAAEALLTLGEPGRALETVQRGMGEKPDGWLLAAAAALALGARPDAQEFLAQARARRALGFEHLHRVARMNQLEGALG